ncbi:MAG: hypothetical protein WA705_22160 [Candidatus Ozemobacteraceae bacterium]
MLKNIKICLVVLVLVAMTGSVFAASGKAAVQWKPFVGAWFEILYPADFVAKPSLVDQNNPAAFSSAFFTSRNGEVEFYVFSPKFNMAPKDSELNRDLENQVSSTEKNNRGIITKKMTISAKDGSYIRMIEDVTDTSGPNVHVRRVFGIKYKDQNVLDQNKKMFDSFKKSLVEKRD